ncbi:peptidase family M48-domain-containing protein [Polychytrium aggregatum]|uniref:peptidase family M48-domain-containing protein n=1 Tax=Polychytrium aggregatum TaxID=110093 RepID=UPI0022FE8166|nr:peptidase family M48-domain-containing protein [Polychytrium aggregatum]KAI9203278.1 peptidase family M48-domain-containing protein [Polychytrium aggregatum]
MSSSSKLPWTKMARNFHGPRLVLSPPRSSSVMAVASSPCVLWRPVRRLATLSHSPSPSPLGHWIPSSIGNLPDWEKHHEQDSESDSESAQHFPWAAGLLVFGFSSVATVASATYDPHPLTGRSRFLFFDEAIEQRLGETGYTELLSAYGNKLVPPTHEAHQFVSSIVHSLVAAAGISDLREWTVHLVQDDSLPNALVLPSGQVFVFTGLSAIAESEAELAVILSHELAHVLSMHTAEKTCGQRVADLLWGNHYHSSHGHDQHDDGHQHTPASSLTTEGPLKASSPLSGPLQIALEMLVGTETDIINAHSRTCEFEADLVGMYLLALAGYDPTDAVRLWEKWAAIVHEHSPSLHPQTLPEPALAEPQHRQQPLDHDAYGQPALIQPLQNTHPSEETRAATLRQHLPAALALYRHIKSNPALSGPERSPRSLREANQILRTKFKTFLPHHVREQQQKLADASDWIHVGWGLGAV